MPEPRLDVADLIALEKTLREAVPRTHTWEGKVNLANAIVHVRQRIEHEISKGYTGNE